MQSFGAILFQPKNIRSKLNEYVYSFVLFINQGEEFTRIFALTYVQIINCSC